MTSELSIPFPQVMGIFLCTTLIYLMLIIKFSDEG